MSKYQKHKPVNPGPQSAVQTKHDAYGAVRTRTYEGALGYVSEAKGELFKLAVSFMGGDANFYETDKLRHTRLIALINQDEVINDLLWLHDFVGWLRHGAGMRTVSMVVAIEAVRGRLSRGLSGSVETAQNVEVTHADLIDEAMARADEPAEFLAYFTSQYGQVKWDGSKLPMAIKKGIAKAAVRLWNEYSVLKYKGTSTKHVTMKDVLRLTHPKAKAPWQVELHEYIKNGTVGEHLPMIRTRQQLTEFPTVARKSLIANSPTELVELFKAAGFTWENVSEWSPEGMTGRVWDLIIPNMGIFALLRNLRNFDQKGISRESRGIIYEKLEDADTIRKSGIFPYQIYSAYKAVESVHWARSLEAAMEISVSNIPDLPGKTLILVDMSGSMFTSKMSDKSDRRYYEVAALFGAAWKIRLGDSADLYQFGSRFHSLGSYRTTQHSELYGKVVKFGENGLTWRGTTKKIDIGRGASVLRTTEQFHDMGGTELHAAIRETWNDSYDRVIILTDEQAFGGGLFGNRLDYDDLPITRGNVYIWNLGGYAAGIAEVGKYKRHSFAGLSDQAFKMVPILDSGRSVGWPWEVTPHGEGGPGSESYFSMRG